MSDKIYALFLRLYPSRFREAYGEDALELFRNRAAHERGFSAKCSLWLDVSVDLALSLPCEYRRQRAARLAFATKRLATGAPSFFVLQSKPPRPGLLLTGMVVSLVALFVFANLLRRIVVYAAPPSTQVTTSQPPAQAKLDAAARREVVAAAIDLLSRHYPDPALAQKMADSLVAYENSGDDDAAPTATAFADLLTAQMRAVSHDTEIVLAYSQSQLPQSPLAPPSAEAQARYRATIQQQNCTIEKVQMLPGNIGYLKINYFPMLDVCREKAAAAMAQLNNSSAVIFDLRDNTGGFPDTVAFVGSYLFDHPEYWFNPRENTTVHSWTQPVAGNRLADKPVYLLTSSRTASGAEQFVFDLKMLKRATIVGEKTAGAAHAGVFHRLNDHFSFAFPEAKPINPFASRGWQDTGIAPDVPVPPSEALTTTQRLARSATAKM